MNDLELGFGIRAMRAALVVAVAVAMATQATAGLARPPTLRRWALSTCEVRARERLNASGSNFAGTGDRDQQECSTIDHLSGQCSPSFTDGTGDGAELVGITYLVSPELAPESIAAPQTLPPQLSVTLTSEGIVCSAGVTTIALVVIGGMCMWRATRGKHYRAAATMQAAARGFLARLLFQAMHMSLALRLIQRVARGMLARRKEQRRAAHLDAWHRHLPHRAACKVQAAARGYLVRHRAPAPPSLGRPLAPPRSAAADSAHHGAPVDGSEKVDSTPRTTRACKTRTRGGAKARAKKSAAAAGVPQWPEAMPGILNFRVPDTPCGSGAHIALLLFPHMVPMADFPLAKCDALRRVVVGRLERIGLAHRGLLQVVLEAIQAESAVKRAHPERHPGNSTTPLVRFLGDYLKAVEDAGRLVVVRGEVYKDFARYVEARAEPEAEDSGSEEESNKDACPLTDSQLKNIYDNGTPLMRSLLSVNDRRRLELILSGQADDKSDDELDPMAAHAVTQGAGA